MQVLLQLLICYLNLRKEGDNISSIVLTNVLPDILSGMLSEMRRQGYNEETIKEAEKLLQGGESRDLIIKRTLDKSNVDVALERYNEIQNISTEIILLRHRIGESSKIIGHRLFDDNSETTRIATNLPRHQVTNDNQLHIFIDDLHKYLIQSGHWKDLELLDKPSIKKCLNIINRYRQSFDHIFDMKGEGKGTEQAYKELGDINNELLSHRVISINEYPILQIRVLEEVRKMLNQVDENIEKWIVHS